jgi:hypothetical protein
MEALYCQYVDFMGMDKSIGGEADVLPLNYSRSLQARTFQNLRQR